MQGQSSEFQAELPNVCSWRSVLSSCGHPLHCFPERDIIAATLSSSFVVATGNRVNAHMRAASASPV